MLRVQGLLLLQKFEIMEKLYSSKTCLKMAGGEDASPTSNVPSKSLFSVRGMEGSVSSKKKVCAENFKKKNSTF